MAKRHVLFIFSDQQQRDALGCMGNVNVHTPVLDGLAERGVLFRRCYSNNPVCGPFRGTLLTGQYTSTCGVKGNGMPLPAGTTTWADAFKAGGYQTSWVGKWHLGGNGNGPIAEELRGGFERFKAYQCYNGFYKDVCFYDEAGVEHRFEKHRTEATTDLSIGEVEAMAGKDKPFLLMVSYQAPHYPVQPRPEYLKKYARREIVRRPNCVDVEPHTPTFSPRSPRPVEEDPDYQAYGGDLDEYIRRYNAMCEQIDTNVGRLLAALEAAGVLEETLVIYTSDHGDMQGSHGLKNKCLPHEESAGIPLVVSGAGVAGGRVSDAVVSGIDFMPTCLEMAGLEAVASVDGVSFAGVLRGEAERAAERVFCEGEGWCMVVEDGWKLAAAREEATLRPTMLTDLDSDPYEMRNRVADESVAGRREAMLGQLAAWDKQVRGRG